MPFGVKRSGNKWETYNKKTGKVYGKHSSKKKAISQLAAIKSNYNEEFIRELDQALGLIESSESRTSDPQATTSPKLGARKGNNKGSLEKKYVRKSSKGSKTKTESG